MVKSWLEKDLREVIEKLGYEIPGDILVSISPKFSFGDYTTNVALQLAKQPSAIGHQSSVEIANKIKTGLESGPSTDGLVKIEVVPPGFVNFFIKKEILAGEVSEILAKGANFGKNDLGKGKKVQVEFISANPTGPLTLAGGRGGVLGDTLANVLSYSGYQAEREYYVNDTGNQVRLLGESVRAGAGKIESSPDHYQGKYVKDLVKKFPKKLDLDSQELGHILADYLLESEVKPAIQRLGIKFDRFFSERSLYPDHINHVLSLLLKSSFSYEREGAVWFKSTSFGDEEDRVLLTSGQTRGKEEPTYFLSDVAYHLEVLERGFDLKINVWGADHHGYVKRIQAALEALGFKNRLKIILMQFVKLIKRGKEVKMSKRAGIYVTLDELLDEVGKDVIRFFFMMYDPNSHISFNLDLAKERNQKNPVFYVQYAHARMAGILRKTARLAPESTLGAESKRAVGRRKTEDEDENLSLLTHQSEIELIKHLLEFPSLVEEIAKSYEVHHLSAYAIKLADLFNKFYESCPVLQAKDKSLMLARLSLVKASQITLANTLSLMGISAPLRM